MTSSINTKDFRMSYIQLIPGGFSPRKICYCHPAPMLDLTRFGIEPNPGPKKGKAEMKNNSSKPKSQQSSAVTKVPAPAAIAFRNQQLGPRSQKTSKSFRVQHRELVSGSIAGSTTFTVQSTYQLNPGLAATFPWLAPQAIMWEQYTCHKLDFVYIPIAPTSTQGTILLTPDYDASRPAPTTETQASDEKGSVEDSCWRDIRVSFDKSAMMGLGPRKYVRPCAVAGDVKTFDVGKLFVSSNNQTGTSAVGKLFVEYDFEFFIPQNDPSPSTVPQFTSWYTLHSGQSLTTSSYAVINWDTKIFDGLLIGAGSSGTFTPPAGCYKVMVQATFQDTSNETFTAQLKLTKNGADLSPTVLSQTKNLVSASGTFSVSIMGLFACNGTDTFAITALAVGAGGTLTLVADECQLVVNLA